MLKGQFIATNSPRSINPLLLTVCFSITGPLQNGGNTHAPAPQGPGLPRQESSVKNNRGSSITFVDAGDHLLCPLTTSLALLSWTDDPSPCQHSGLCLLGCNDSN